MAIERMTVDFDARILRVELADGRDETMPLPPEFVIPGPEIRRFVVDYRDRELTLRLPHGDVTVELGWPGSRDLPPSDLPIVYLDQLHWITLAQQLFAPAKVADRDRHAAETLIDLARARRILLPLSSAHLVESSPAGGRRQAQLAATMLELSRGWQMRNPVQVRALELQAALAGKTPHAEGVFTLEPDVLFTEFSAQPTGSKQEELIRRLTAMASVYAAVVDDEELDMSDGHRKAAAWAKPFHDLATYMRQEQMSKERAQLVARARLLADLGDETAAAAAALRVEVGEFRAWLDRRAEDGLAEMPYLGRAEGVLYQRLRNADDKWDRSDLFDMNFLCCAAGYADVLVGEKKTSEYLKRIRDQVTPGAFVCRTLAEAVARLEALAEESQRSAA